MDQKWEPTRQRVETVRREADAALREAAAALREELRHAATRLEGIISETAAHCDQSAAESLAKSEARSSAALTDGMQSVNFRVDTAQQAALDAIATETATRSASIIE